MAREFILWKPAQQGQRPSVWSVHPTAEAAEVARAGEAFDGESLQSYQVGTWEEYEAALRAYYLGQPIKEVDAEQWEYALNVLPPMGWETVEGVERFMIRERICATFTTQYAKVRGRYFEKIVDTKEPKTWLTGAALASFLEA